MPTAPTGTAAASTSTCSARSAPDAGRLRRRRRQPAVPAREREPDAVQALTLLNDPVFVECAAALGERLPQGGRGGRLDGCVRLRADASAAHPGERELAVLARPVRQQRKLGAKEEAVWAGVARVLLNLEEFTTRE